MNKKLNTILFILGATLFNILTTVLSFILLILFYTKVIERFVPENIQVQAWPYVLIFIVAIALSFVIYRYALRFLTNKIDIEKYLDPIFGPRRRK